MKITNKQFIDRVLSGLPAGKLLMLLWVIKELMIHHQLQWFLKQEKQTGDLAEVYALAWLLESYDKLSRKDVSSLLRLLKVRNSQLAQQFTVSSGSVQVIDELQWRVEQQNSEASLDLQSSNTIGLVVEGENRLYKRTLKGDVAKLLR